MKTHSNLPIPFSLRIKYLPTPYSLYLKTWFASWTGNSPRRKTWSFWSKTIMLTNCISYLWKRKSISNKRFPTPQSYFPTLF